MSPDSEPDSPATDADEVRGDPGFDERAMYLVVRHAVEDAILGVLGTLMLLGIGFVVIWAGGTLIVTGESAGAAVAGLLIVAWGLYIAATALEIIPPAREWF